MSFELGSVTFGKSRFAPASQQFRNRNYIRARCDLCVGTQHPVCDCAGLNRDGGSVAELDGGELQRFPNFFQVGTTFISQNVLRTILLLSPLKANCLRFSTTVYDTQFTLILFFLSFFD
jgi:hypothetical protein